MDVSKMFTTDPKYLPERKSLLFLFEGILKDEISDWS